MTSPSTEHDATAAELVRRLLDAEARHDLVGYRELLEDGFTEMTDGEITSRHADDAAYAAARSWALAPSAHRRIDEINATEGCVSVRYHLDRAMPITKVTRDRPGDFIGYSIYETRDGHMIRAGHFLSEQHHQMTSARPTAQSEPAITQFEERRNSRRARLVGASMVVASVLAAEPVWAAPVVAATAWRGPVIAFSLFAPIYIAIGYAGSLLVIRRSARRAPAGWMERWLRGGADRHYLRGIRRLLQAGTLLGFVLSSAMFGAIVTTWLSMEFGRRGRIRRLSFISSVIFAVTFVGFYAGIASLIF